MLLIRNVNLSGGRDLWGATNQLSLKEQFMSRANRIIINVICVSLMIQVLFNYDPWTIKPSIVKKISNNPKKKGKYKLIYMILSLDDIFKFKISI